MCLKLYLVSILRTSDDCSTSIKKATWLLQVESLYSTDHDWSLRLTNPYQGEKLNRIISSSTYIAAWFSLWGRKREERVLRTKNSMVCKARSYGGAVKRAVASHQYGQGLNPGVRAICGLSLLLVLSFAPRGFSPGTLVFLLSLKPSIYKFQFEQQPALWRCVTFKSSFVGPRRSCWK